MNNIDKAIEALQQKIADLEQMKTSGYVVEEVANYGEYTMRDDHSVIYDLDGKLVGIVVNLKLMKKYFADMERV